MVMESLAWMLEGCFGQITCKQQEREDPLRMELRRFFNRFIRTAVLIVNADGRIVYPMPGWKHGHYPFLQAVKGERRLLLVLLIKMT